MDWSWNGRLASLPPEALAVKREMRSWVCRAILAISGEDEDELIPAATVSGGFHGEESADRAWDAYVEYASNGYQDDRWSEILLLLVQRASQRLYEVALSGRYFNAASNDRLVSECLHRAVLAVLARAAA